MAEIGEEKNSEICLRWSAAEAFINLIIEEKIKIK